MGFKLFAFFISLVFSLSVFAADKAKILKELEGLYPHFSAAEIQDKIDQTKDPQSFLRGFNIYFYHSLKNNPVLMGPLIKLGSEAGWCVGDAHFENFGAVLGRNGKAQLTINDLDDAGPCPLITDTVKYLTSLLLEGHVIQFPLVMMSYRQGLNLNGPSLPSAETRTLLAGAEKLGPRIDPSDLATPTTLKRKDNSRDTTPTEQDFITKSVKTNYGGAWDVLDSYAYSKVGGGSHGLQRFRALIKNGALLQQIQFKQLVKPGVSPVAVGPMPEQATRIKTTLKIEQGAEFSPFYSVQSSPKPMLLQAIWVGDLDIKKDNYTPAQAQNLIYDQIRQLAKIHLKTASKEYVAGVNNTSDMEWLIASRNMGQYIIEVYNTLKK